MLMFVVEKTEIFQAAISRHWDQIYKESCEDLGRKIKASGA